MYSTESSSLTRWGKGKWRMREGDATRWGKEVEDEGG